MILVWKEKQSRVPYHVLHLDLVIKCNYISFPSDLVINIIIYMYGLLLHDSKPQSQSLCLQH